jgi:serine phosphatase RsbU (regulator of sigma subunit)
MLPGFPYAKSATLELAAGDMLVMLTDGFWEWENSAGEDFGLARLKEAVVAAAGQSAAEVIARLAAAVEGFAAGARQGDDLTAVVIRRLAAQGHGR